MRPAKHLEAAEEFFGADAPTLVLAPGEVLLTEGQANRRLYLILHGELRCEGRDETGQWRELFVLRAGDLAGVTSFFGRPHTSIYSMTAIGEVSLAYIDRADIPDDEIESVDANLVPLVVHALHRRDVQRSDLERMLGVAEFGAGIAHELNNSLAVITQSWGWLERVASRHLIEGRDPAVVEAFRTGRGERLPPPAAEVRARSRGLVDRFGWPEAFARRWARAGLADPPQGGDPADVLEFFEMGEVLRDATSAVAHTRHVLDQMNALARRPEPRTSTFDVVESVRGGLALVKHLLVGIDVEIAAERPVPVACDRLQIEQVWANLARNAVNALRDAPPAEQPRLVFACDVTAGMGRVRVTDNGPGIAADILPDIFTPRVSSAQGRISVGLGLGLSLARSIVTANGGVIEARNVAPHGAQFEVRLRLASLPGQPGPAAPSPAPPPDAAERARSPQSQNGAPP